MTARGGGTQHIGTSSHRLVAQAAGMHLVFSGSPLYHVSRIQRVSATIQLHEAPLNILSTNNHWSSPEGCRMQHVWDPTIEDFSLMAERPSPGDLCRRIQRSTASNPSGFSADISLACSGFPANFSSPLHSPSPRIKLPSARTRRPTRAAHPSRGLRDGLRVVRGDRRGSER